MGHRKASKAAFGRLWTHPTAEDMRPEVEHSLRLCGFPCKKAVAMSDVHTFQDIVAAKLSSTERDKRVVVGEEVGLEAL